MATQQAFKDKVVVITGASGGLGRATAWEFARQGARLVLVARGAAGLEAACKESISLGGQALPFQADVSDPDQIEGAARFAEEKFGPIDVWVNNAMNSVFAPFREVSPAEFKRVTEVTYLGQVYGTMAALKRMSSRGGGSIILVGSALAYRGIPLQSAYCGSKHAIEGFYDSLRTELMHEKSPVRICMLQMPAMNTTQFGWVLNRMPKQPRPMGKIYQPEMAARAIVFAAAHNRRFMWVGWPTYKAIIGNMVARGYADHVLAKNGIQGQLTRKKADPSRPNNIWEPVDEDRGSHGRFDRKAHWFSLTTWVSMHRWVWLIAAAILILILVYILK